MPGEKTEEKPLTLCAECGGTNVQISLPAWVNPDTLEVVDLDLEARAMDTHCTDCEDNTALIDRDGNEYRGWMWTS